MRTASLLLMFGIVLMQSGCTTLKNPTFADDAGAIRGYDAVAYHTEGQPVKGNPAFTYEYNDATWSFSSKENLELFRANPDRYAPQYGGYCAYGVSLGVLVPVDIDTWEIIDGRLHLQFSPATKQKFDENRETCILAANESWDRIASERRQPVED